MSFAQCKDNLKNGKYESVTGARRGIGKFKDMTEEEKNAAPKIADKHFGAEPAAAKPGPAAKRAATTEGVDPVVQAGVDAVNSAGVQADLLLRAVNESRSAAQVFGNSNTIYEQLSAAASARLLEIVGGMGALKTDLNTAVANAASSGNGVSETTAPQGLQSAMPGMPSTLPGLPVR